MKNMLQIAAGVAALIIPVCAVSAPPVPPKALGNVEAIVNFCVRVDQESADKYKSLQKAVTHDMTEKELAEARDSADYKEAYDAVTGELEKIPAEKAPKSCRAALEQSSK